MKKYKPLLIAIVLLVLYLVLDYYNLPSLVGFNPRTINTDLLGIVIGALTALIIFALTYLYVDKWNISKQYNQKSTAIKLLESVYLECLKDTKDLDGKLLNILVKKTDFNDYFPGSAGDRYSDMPFEHEELIFQCAIDGTITAELFNTYLEVKKLYKRHFALSVILFDAPEKVSPTKSELISKLNQALDQLRKSS